jgi:hypothetical protein
MGIIACKVQLCYQNEEIVVIKCPEVFGHISGLTLQLNKNEVSVHY